MKKWFTTWAAIALAIGLSAAPVQQAQAHHKTGAIIAGIAVGALVTGAIIHHNNKKKRHGNVYNFYQQTPKYNYSKPRRIQKPVQNNPRAAWKRHVKHCYNRYKTYNHRTNTFHAGGGHYKVCRSRWF